MKKGRAHLKNVLKSLLAHLDEKDIEVEYMYMSQQTADIFTHGDEDVEVIIDNDFPFKQFFYKRKGKPVNKEEDRFEFWAATEEQFIISEFFCSQKRVDQ